MKKLLCIVSKDVIRRNIYETDFLPNLIRDNPDTQIHILTEAVQQNAFTSLVGNANNVLVHSYDRHSYYGWNRFLFFLARTGVHSHSTKTYRRRAYCNKESSLLQLVVKEVIAQTVGRFGLYKRGLRALVQRSMTIDQDLKNIFDVIKPDIVFAPSLIDNDYDVPVAIEARRRDIRVVGMVRSWDNLNNHGALTFVPDRFIVQNVWLTEAAERFQGLRKKTITDIVGLPHYDTYKHPDAVLKDRTTFFTELGLDPTKKLLLLGGSDFYYSEDVLPKTLDDLIESGTITEPAQVFFRPHPRSLFNRDAYGVDSLSHVVLDGGLQGATGFSDGEKLINLFHHADVILHIASTMAIDAAVFNTPTISINYDEQSKHLPYWNHVKRLHDTFDHYEHLVQTGGCATPSSKDELASTINRYLADPAEDQEGRKRILDAFVEPFDGFSGARLAEILTKEIKNL